MAASGTIPVELPDRSVLNIPITSTTRLWHVLGSAAKSCGATEYEATLWKAYSKDRGELLPGNLRACALPAKCVIRVEAPKPPLSGGWQPALLLKTTTPRAAKKEDAGMLTVTVKLDVADPNQEQRTSSTSFASASRKNNGMLMKVAVMSNEQVVTLRDRVEALGFLVDPAQRLAVDGRAVGSEQITFKELRVGPNNVLSYVDRAATPRRNVNPLSSSRSYTGTSASSSFAGSPTSATTPTSVTNASRSTPAAPGSATVNASAFSTARPTSPRRPLSPQRRHASPGRNRPASPGRNRSVSAMNTSAVSQPRAASSVGERKMYGEDRAPSPAYQSFANYQPTSQSYLKSPAAAGEGTSPVVPPLHLPTPSQAALLPNFRPKPLIHHPGPNVRILVEDADDGGHVYEVNAATDRTVGSLLEFVTPGANCDVFCDGRLCDESDSFLYATRGLPGCLFSFHKK